MLHAQKGEAWNLCSAADFGGHLAVLQWCRADVVEWAK